MPKHTISRSNSPYLSIITGKSLVGSSDLTIILSRSAGSISSKRGRNLNHVLTVIGRMTILSPTSFPAGIDFLSLKSNGILTGCSVMEADSNLNKFFMLINLSKGAIPLYFRENSIIFATIIELFRPYPSKVCFYRRITARDYRNVTPFFLLSAYYVIINDLYEQTRFYICFILVHYISLYFMKCATNVIPLCDTKSFKL